MDGLAISAGLVPKAVFLALANQTATPLAVGINCQGMVTRTAAHKSAFRARVKRVGGVVPRKQMILVDAKRVVAAMASFVAVG
jgi:hypothetical protein